MCTYTRACARPQPAVYDHHVLHVTRVTSVTERTPNADPHLPLPLAPSIRLARTQVLARKPRFEPALSHPPLTQGIDSNRTICKTFASRALGKSPKTMILRNILVTGGTGFFGKAFIRTVLERGLSERVCVFSRSEFAQHQFRSELQDDERLRWFIGDVRDRDRLTRAMHGVDTVIHAAALKRVEVCEYNALECVATNVIGTENVVKAAIDAGVQRAVLVSTDKACNPINTYGMSKALAERVFLSAGHYAGESGTKFAVVRYGNVAGSTGSLIPIWRARHEAGMLCEIRDPDATRYWMREDEAVDLVIHTAQSMRGGEVSIPVLPAYRLADLAEAMGVTTFRTKLLKGEKMHETMDGITDSSQARRMSVAELRKALQHV